MKKEFLILLSVFLSVGAAASAHADHHVKLSDELKPLEFLVGDWIVEIEGDDGVTHKITTSTKPDAEGHVIRTSGQWLRDGELLVAWFELTYARAKSKEITSTVVVSNGSISQGSAAIHDGVLVTRYKGTNSDGQEVSHESHVKMVDKDTYTSQRKNRTLDGEARDDWPVATFKRVK